MSLRCLTQVIRAHEDAAFLPALSFRRMNMRCASQVIRAGIRIARPGFRGVINVPKLKELHKSFTCTMASIQEKHKSVCMQARAEVAELLTLARKDSSKKDGALLKVEWVIKQQNYLDALFMVARQPTGEMKEVVASLLYAAPRCGEIPEIQEIATVLRKYVGRNFYKSSTELLSGCGVNPTMTKKLSLNQPNLESKFMMIQEIGKGIGLEIIIPEYDEEDSTFEISEASSNPTTNMTRQRSYVDIADAARRASEAISDASYAARIAVQLMEATPSDYSRPTPPKSNSSTTHDRHFLPPKSGSCSALPKFTSGSTLSKSDSSATLEERGEEERRRDRPSSIFYI
ncbi:hypothetical protein ACLOJK_034561 [Asimina triloba]